eukprot:scaffold1319_cov139-Skeletonema_menzelii.AAC.1
MGSCVSYSARIQNWLPTSRRAGWQFLLLLLKILRILLLKLPTSFRMPPYTPPVNERHFSLPPVLVELNLAMLVASTNQFTHQITTTTSQQHCQHVCIKISHCLHLGVPLSLMGIPDDALFYPQSQISHQMD